MTGRTTTGRTKARRPLLRPRRTTLRTSPPPRVESPSLNSSHSVLIDVMRDMPAIPKRGENQTDRYFYRLLDDVIATLHDVCARHGLSIVPIDVDVTQKDVRRADNSLSELTRTCVKVTYELDGPGEFHKIVKFPGEAIDKGDKSTMKAMSQAWKYLMAQVFLIPSEEVTTHAEADHNSPHPATVINNQRRNNPPPRNAQPSQGRQIDEAAHREADYITTALDSTYEDCRALYMQAEKSGVSPAVLVTIRRIGEKKKGTESAQNQPTGQTVAPQPNPEHSRAEQEPSTQEEAGGETPRAVPDTPARPQSDEQTDFIAALTELRTVAQAAGHTEPSDVAQAFFAKHGWVMEDASPAEIRDFAASMTPAEPGSGQDGKEQQPDTNPEGA